MCMNFNKKNRTIVGNRGVYQLGNAAASRINQPPRRPVRPMPSPKTTATRIGFCNGKKNRLPSERTVAAAADVLKSTAPRPV